MISESYPALSYFYAPEESEYGYIVKHSHSEAEIIFCVRGCVEVRFNNSHCALSDEMIIIINSSVSHSVLADKDSRIMRIMLSGFNSDIPYTVEYTVFRNKDEDYKELSELIKSSFRNFECRSPKAVMKGDYYYFLGFMRKRGLLNEKKTDNSPKLTSILNFIEKNYAEKITLELLSRKFYISPNYLGRLFREKTACSVVEYINFVRMKNAERLLAKTKLSILEIANTVGFSSQTHFNRLFKKHTSMTPTAYRKYNTVL